MGFIVPRHISFCRDGESTILLDLRRDWYFQLDPPLEPTFAALVRDDAPSLDTDMLQRLVDLGVIEARAGADARPTPASCPTPALSWRDAPPAAPSSGSLLFAAEVWAAVRRARRDVRKVPFEQLIERMRACKRRLSEPAGETDLVRLAVIAARFGRVRRGIPIDRICLQDSLALFELCARRRLFPDFVIGIATAPFKAHCWLQSGSIVLNEALDCAQSFQPILVA